MSLQPGRKMKGRVISTPVFDVDTDTPHQVKKTDRWLLVTVASDDDTLMQMPAARTVSDDLMISFFPVDEGEETYGGVQFTAAGDDVFFVSGGNGQPYRGNHITFGRGSTVLMRPIQLSAEDEPASYGWLILWASAQWPQVETVAP